MLFSLFHASSWQVEYKKYNLLEEESNVRKRIIALLVVSCCFLGLSTSAFAEESEYDLNIPYPFVNSMRSTKIIEKKPGESPYVNPKTNTIYTNYFLSPEPRSSITATNVIRTNTTGRRNFTYNSGYGGVGTSYCLSAYPGVTGDYDPYNVRGKWCR